MEEQILPLHPISWAQRTSARKSERERATPSNSKRRTFSQKLELWEMYVKGATAAQKRCRQAPSQIREIMNNKARSKTKVKTEVPPNASQESSKDLISSRVPNVNTEQQILLSQQSHATQTIIDERRTKELPPAAESEWIDQPELNDQEQARKIRSADGIGAFARELDDYIQYCRRFESLRAEEKPASDGMSDSRFAALAEEYGDVSLSPGELGYLKGRLSALLWVQGHGWMDPDDDLYLN